MEVAAAPVIHHILAAPVVIRDPATAVLLRALRFIAPVISGLAAVKAALAVVISGPIHRTTLLHITVTRRRHGPEYFAPRCFTPRAASVVVLRKRERGKAQRGGC